MDILKSKAGYTIVYVSHQELLKFGHVPPVCDGCMVGLGGNENYYIAVMHSTYCKKCYTKWNEESKFYKEDIAYQEKKLSWVMGKLNNKQEEKHV